MVTFDAPSRDLCSVQRGHTSTPLQALVLLNDPQFLEAAEALARRAVTEVGDDPEAVISYMFALATSRRPEADELASLSEMVGPHDNVDVRMVASTILNLDETIRKN